LACYGFSGTLLWAFFVTSSISENASISKEQPKSHSESCSEIIEKIFGDTENSLGHKSREHPEKP
jgi:hypothetical protein